MEKIKNFKSTFSLYGVESKYFENMKYYEAVEERIKLVKTQINKIISELDYTMPDDDYKTLNHQLVLCEKALEFNELLLDEYRRKRTLK